MAPRISTHQELRLLVGQVEQAMRTVRQMRKAVEGVAPDDPIFYELRARLELLLELLESLRNLVSGESLPIGWLSLTRRGSRRSP